jgi:CheY-like chemotaxis protein
VCFSDGKALIDFIRLHESGDFSLSRVPTLIVVDLNMPKMDGFEVLRQLKAESMLQDVPVIVVSSATSFENISRAFALKAAAFFKKPLNACDLRVFLRHGWPWPPKP